MTEDTEKLEVIPFRGNKQRWRKFVNELRLKNEKVWEVLEKFIDEKYPIRNS